MKGKIRILLSFGISLVLLLMIGYYTYNKTIELRKSAEWVDHTRQVISETKTFLLSIQHFESGSRGYLLSGEKRYLDNFESGVNATNESYLFLKKLVTDNHVQKQLLDSVNLLVKEKIAFSSSLIEKYEQDKFEDVKSSLAVGSGDILMRNITAGLNKFIKTEEQYLDKRLLQEHDDFAEILRILFVSILLVILILIVSMVVILRERNKLKRTQSQLTESEFRLKKFLESLPIGIYALNSSGKPYYANSKAVEILGKGISADATIEELSELYSVVISGTDEIFPYQQMPIVKALSLDQELTTEDMEVIIDDQRIPIRVNAARILDSEGNLEYAVAVFEDISDVIAAKEALKQARKIAEESGMLKEKFLANMSHEIRTPMNAIVGFTDLLLRDQLNNQQTDYVRTIKTAGENLLRIINDVLDISKMESGMMDFESDPISIKGIFSSLEAMVGPRAKQKNLRLSFGYAGNLPDTVLGDPTRLTQIILNLVGNAIKFTDRGGVEVFAAMISENSTTCEIKISVKDTGIGIQQDKLDQIFERFAQAESHTTRHYGGTGLGLSIAKQLIELQGGYITVESESGKGSVFEFVLPFTKTNEKAGNKRKKIPLPDIRLLSSKKILLVEDNPINIKLLQYLFEIYHLQYDLAINGQAAVECIMSTSYDIVLMDIEMPEMNGYEATSIIRNELKVKIPIIAMTAHAMAGEKEKCLQAGMNDYITKPIRENQLFESMVRLVSSENTNEDQPEIPLTNFEYLYTALHGRKDVIRETLDIFSEQFPNDLDLLNNALKQGNYVTLGQLAHRMKSNVAMLGVTQLESTFLEIETLALSNADLPAIAKLIETVNALTPKVLIEINKERALYN